MDNALSAAWRRALRMTAPGATDSSTYSGLLLSSFMEDAPIVVDPPAGAFIDVISCPDKRPSLLRGCGAPNIIAHPRRQFTRERIDVAGNDGADARALDLAMNSDVLRNEH